MMPLQTALPLRELAACGYAADPRSELAYDWLLAQRLEDGAWPTGVRAPTDTWPGTVGWPTLAGGAGRAQRAH
jgi:hypothetical protein